MKDKKEYNILVIEDNDGDYFLLEEYLYGKILFPKIKRVESFIETENILTSKTKFDIILLDLSLPDKIGENLIIDVVSIAGNTPIIVLTGYTDFDFSIKSLALGVSDYLLKDELDEHILFKSIKYSIERRRNLLQIKESQKNYSDLFQLSPLPMIVFSIETLDILDTNTAAEELYGYSRNEFLNINVKEIRPKNKVSHFLNIHKNKKGDEPFIGEAVHMKKNGTEIIVELKTKKINYKEKSAELVLINDVTEKRKHIKEIERQNEILRDISWVQSHVVRAPLAKILGLVELMNLNLKTSEKASLEYCKLISKSALELDQIIREITTKADYANLSLKENSEQHLN